MIGNRIQNGQNVHRALYDSGNGLFCQHGNEKLEENSQNQRAQQQNQSDLPHLLGKQNRRIYDNWLELKTDTSLSIETNVHSKQTSISCQQDYNPQFEWFSSDFH